MPNQKCISVENPWPQALEARPVQYRDNGKENGDYCITIGYMLGLYRGKYEENGKKMETTIL